MLEAVRLGRRHPDGKRWLFDDISLELRAGERLAVAGPSGSGKTLLLRALAMLDPLDSGEIRWQKKTVRGDRVPGFRREVMYLHQRAAILEPTVEESLRRPFELRANRGRQFDRQRIASMLQALGRGDSFLEKQARDLSGGETQIVALMRALQLEPCVLLLDEPTAALDPATAAAVEQLVDRWVAELPDRRALVWVSHDSGQAARMGRQFLYIRGGKVVQEDS
jgi:putative ABC transport system ATP-binding protein